MKNIKTTLLVFVFNALTGLIIAGCQSPTNKESERGAGSPDTAAREVTITDSLNKSATKPVIPTSRTYSNERFQEVVVQKNGDSSYEVSGKAQVFEAVISWVVEDGHNELKKGFEMTDAGAPEWGNFQFSFAVQKARENSKLHLILFESSARDGNRTHELLIPLP